MHASDSARIQQRLKIEAIGTTLAECGFVALDEQAYVLGLSRSTAWTVIRAMHKNSGLYAMTINRMLDTVRLPPRIRLKLLESVRKHHAGLHSLRSMRRIEASRRKARPLRLRFSQSLANLRQRLSQAMVRSTIHRFGRTANPSI